MNNCRKLLILLIVLAFSFSSTAHAATLNTFTSNYDADVFQTEQITFQTNSSIPQEWYPLKDTCKHLSIDVSWDNITREVVIDNFPTQQILPNAKEYRYKNSNLPDSLKIEKGVTYCSPEFLRNLLGGIGFLYNNEVYYFAGEDISSKLINPGISDVFKQNTITSMYEMKLKMPNEYEFNRKYLTGGIKCVQRGDDSKVPTYAPAYIYSGAKKPCCCIIGDKAIGTKLATYISHEAYHVWQNRNGCVNEPDAKAYGEMIKSTLNSIN